MFIDTNDQGQITIEKPFSIQFNIVRNILSSANAATFRVYNLNKTTRERIAKDRTDFQKEKKVLFYAGYENDMPLCFFGNVRRCRSTREGVDIVTTIEANDAGFAYNNALLENAQYKGGTPRINVARDLLAKLKDFGVSVGRIGRIEGSLKRTSSFSGPTINAITEFTGGTFFIDNGKGYILKEDEIIEGALRVINSDTGLIGTPVKDAQLVEINTIFEPRVIPAQEILIESTTYPEINKNYKITGITHQGMISDSVAGTATTKLSCFTIGAFSRVQG